MKDGKTDAENVDTVVKNYNSALENVGSLMKDGKTAAKDVDAVVKNYTSAPKNV